ncbi:MAG: glycosyltransferase family 2 protein, partial [Candidatus Marinimicrobia bacterium]|nr:glycosyltransferase family 2 protein [Candidatus Neomarinimicrobiota bacterium]
YGISKANSDLIALLDADDLWDSNHLDNLYSLYTSFPKCGLYATNYYKQFFPTRFSNIFIMFFKYSKNSEKSKK